MVERGLSSVVKVLEDVIIYNNEREYMLDDILSDTSSTIDETNVRVLSHITTNIVILCFKTQNYKTK